MPIGQYLRQLIMCTGASETLRSTKKERIRQGVEARYVSLGMVKSGLLERFPGHDESEFDIEVSLKAVPASLYP